VLFPVSWPVSDSEGRVVREVPPREVGGG
jgi:hypothetical protein